MERRAKALLLLLGFLTVPVLGAAPETEVARTIGISITASLGGDESHPGDLYRRPGGTDLYLRPGGTDRYLRP